MKVIPVAILTFFILIFSATLVSAHCPLCTAAAGAGIGITRIYGIDDGITGLFLGALIVSSALWFNKWLKNKTEIPFQESLVVFASFLLLAIPLYNTGIITDFDTVRSAPDQYSILRFGVYGVDKLLFGIIIGTLAVWFSFNLSGYIKEKKGKVLWQYQGLSFMLIILVALSITFLVLT